MIFFGRRGFTLVETILVIVFTAGLLLLMQKAFVVASRTAQRSDSNDSAVFMSSSVLSEEMSRTLRFTSSSLVKVFRYNSGDVAIIGFPTRGWYDRKARDGGKKGFVSPNGLGYYVNNNGLDDELLKGFKGLEWTSYVMYVYCYRNSDAAKLGNADEPRSFGDSKDSKSGDLKKLEFSKAFAHRSIYEIRFLLINHYDLAQVPADSPDGSIYTCFLQKKTSIPSRTNTLEKGTKKSAGGSAGGSDSTVISSSLDFKNFVDIANSASENKGRLLSFRRLTSNVEHFYVSMLEYPLVSVELKFDYGSGGASYRSGSSGLTEKELRDFSFQILPAMR